MDKILSYSKNSQNKIEINKQTAGNFSPNFKLNLVEVNRIKKKNLDQIVETNRLHNINQKSNRNDLILNKHEWIKEVFDIYRLLSQKKKILNEWIEKWIKFLKLVNTLKRISQYTRQKYLEINKMRSVTFNLQTIKIKYSRYIKTKGTSVASRMVLESFWYEFNFNIIFNLQKLSRVKIFLKNQHIF